MMKTLESFGSAASIMLMYVWDDYVTLNVIIKQEEYQASIYWRTGEKPADVFQEYNPNRPYYDLYRVDYAQFKNIFIPICPWAQGVAPEPVCLKTFRVSVVFM